MYFVSVFLQARGRIQLFANDIESMRCLVFVEIRPLRIHSLEPARFRLGKTLVECERPLLYTLEVFELAKHWRRITVARKGKDLIDTG